jgi:hypothetical protein
MRDVAGRGRLIFFLTPDLPDSKLVPSPTRMDERSCPKLIARSAPVAIRR